MLCEIDFFTQPYNNYSIMIIQSVIIRYSMFTEVNKIIGKFTKLCVILFNK